MKIQKTLLALALLIASLSFGQITTNPGTGNVLIGTTTDNAIDKLQVNGTASGSTATLPNQFTIKAQLDLKADDNNVVKLTGNQVKTGILTMTNPSGGGTGIVLNNNSAAEMINLYNSDEGSGIASINTGDGIGINSSNTGGGFGINSVNYSGGSGIVSYNTSTGNGIISNSATSATGFNYVGQNNGTNTFTVDKTGAVYVNTNVGIGTSSFTDGADTYRLSVKGKVRAEEVKVYNTWADYVFAKDYKLPSLKEVETFISQKGHLQNVPSAKEVTEKGLALGEMAKIQQEKIEELTLYLIQQNKEIEELKKENEQYKSLVERVTALEKK